MIFEEELQYINKKAIDTPYPGDNYAFNTINYITYALAIFKQKYEGKRINLLLSNGEEMFFEIKGKHLANLLGIDYRTIATDKEIRSVLGYRNYEHIDPYELLSRIVSYGSDVVIHDELKSNKILNYYRVMVKISYFLKLSSFDKFDFGVINFDKEKYERLYNRKLLSDSRKLLLFPNNDEIIPFSMISFIYEKDSSTMIPESFIISPNFKKLMSKQEFLLPTEMLVDGSGDYKRILLTDRERIQLLNLYKSIILTYMTNSSIKEKLK